MSEKDLKPQQNSDEIDLGQLFKVIGNMFERLFGFIGNILKKLFWIILLVLIGARKHFLKIALLLAIGYVAGFLIDRSKVPVYGANLIVEPNYGSARQLYNNINYYNALVEDKDTMQLSRVFNIKPSDAAKLKGFFIQPDDNENSRLQSYSRILKNLDSTAIKYFDYDSYKENTQPTEFAYHIIGVASLDKSIYPSLQPSIINSIENNKYFQLKKKATLKNLQEHDSIIGVSLVDTDSLKKELLKLKNIEANKDPVEGGTSIIMAQGRENNTDIMNLLERKIMLSQRLNNNRIERVEREEIIKVISDFPREGYVERSFISQLKYSIPLLLLGGFVLLLMLLQLNKFLLEKERDLKQLQ